MLIARLNAKKNQRINDCLLEKICITSKKKEQLFQRYFIVN